MKRSYTYLKGLLTLALAAFTGWMWAADPVATWTDFNTLTSGTYTITKDAACTVNADGSITLGGAGLSVSLGAGQAIYDDNSITVVMDVSGVANEGPLVAFTTGNQPIDLYYTGSKLRQRWSTDAKKDSDYGNVDWTPARATIAFTYDGRGQNGTSTYIDGTQKMNTAGLRFTGTGSVMSTLTFPATTGMTIHSLRLYSTKLSATDAPVVSTALLADTNIEFNGNYNIVVKGSNAAWIPAGFNWNQPSSYVDTPTGKGFLVTDDGSIWPCSDAGNHNIPTDGDYTVALYANASNVADNATLWWIGHNSWQAGNAITLMKTDADTVSVRRINGGTGTVYAEYTSDDLTKDTYRLYVVTVDNETDTTTINLYVDGVKTAGTVTTKFTADKKIQIGNAVGNASQIGLNHAKGMLVDNFYGWNKALTDAEVAALTSVMTPIPAPATYIRTIDANANWSATEAWTLDGTSTVADVPAEGKDATITATADATLTVNATANVGVFTTAGAGTLTIASEGTNKLAAQKTNIETNTIVNAGAATLGAASIANGKTLTVKDVTTVTSLSGAGTYEMALGETTADAYTFAADGKKYKITSGTFTNAALALSGTKTTYEFAGANITMAQTDGIGQFSFGTADVTISGGTINATHLVTVQNGGSRPTTITQTGGNIILSGTGNGSGTAMGAQTIMFGHWPSASSAYTLSGGSLVAENGGMRISNDSPATVTVSGGLLKVKGIKGKGGNATSLTLSGGKLSIGDWGMDAINALTFTAQGGEINAFGNATINQAIALNGNVTLSADADKTLTIYTMTGTGSLTIAGQGTVALPESVVKTIPVTVAAGATLKVIPTMDTIVAGKLVLAEGSTINGAVAIDGVENVTANGATISFTANAEITGSVWWWDYEFNGSNASIGSDTGTVTLEGTGTSYTEAVDGNQALYFQKTPYRGAEFASQDAFTAVMYCQPGNYNNVPLVSFGTLNGTAVILATGANAAGGEMQILLNRGNSLTSLADNLIVPNATTANHLYAFTYEVQAEQTVISVYVDGKLKKVTTIPEQLHVSNGFQIGSVHGGVVTGLTKYSASGNSGTIDFLRVAKGVLGADAMKALAQAYPYVSENGIAQRTIDADTTWVADAAWTQKMHGQADATQAAPNAGTNIALTVDAASEVTVNLDADATYETMTVAGSAAVKFVADAHKILAGDLTVATNTTIEYGAIEVGTLTVEAGKTLTFDFTNYAFDSIYASKVISLTGLATVADGAEVTAVLPELPTYMEATFAKNETTGEYELTITVDGEVSATIGADGNWDSITWALDGVTVGGQPDLSACETLPLTVTADATLSMNKAVTLNNLTISGEGALTIAENGGNKLTVSGATTINTNVTATAGAAAFGQITIANGKSLGIKETIANVGTITSNAGELVYMMEGTITEATRLVDAMGKIRIASGTVDFTEPNGDYRNGRITIDEGATMKTTGQHSAPFGNSPIVNNGAIVVASTGTPWINTVVSGKGSLTLDSGELTLIAANTYEGGTTVNGGTLVISGTAAETKVLPEGKTVTVNAGATVKLVQGLSFVTIEGEGTVLVAGGTYTYGIASEKGVDSDLTAKTVEVAEGGVLQFRAWRTYALSVENLVVNGTLKNDGYNGATAVTLTVAKDQKISGAGTVQLATTLADGALVGNVAVVPANATVQGSVICDSAEIASALAEKLTPPAGYKYVATENVVTIAIAKVNVTIPQAPANTKWYMGETEVSGTIPVDPNQEIILTLKAENGTVFADGTTSKDVPVTVGNTDAEAKLPENSTAATPVAQIVGGNKYQTLQAAIDAADAGAEVTVIAGIVTDGPITVTKQVTVNLNNQTIEATNDKVGDGVFYVLAGGDLTINGEGTVNALGDNGYCMAVWARNGGKVTINGGTYTNVGAYSEEDGDHFDLIYVRNGGEITINGGTFICAKPRWTLNSRDDEPGTIIVKGGKFYQLNPADVDTNDGVTTWCAEGHIAVAEGEYYVVVKISETAVAMIGKAGYNTLAEAIEAATPGQTITLVKDIEVVGTTDANRVVINKAITLDGNGKTITATSTSSSCRAINIDCEGEVTLQNLVVVAAGQRAINVIEKPCTLTLDKVDAMAYNYAVYIAPSAGAAKVAIDGCNFTGLAVVYVCGEKSQVTIANSTIANVDANDDENYGAITVWSTAIGATVDVTNTTITVMDDSMQAYNFIPDSATITGVDKVGSIVAKIGDAGYDTIEEAAKDVTADQTIVLVTDVSTSTPLAIAGTIDLAGKTLTADIAGTIKMNGGTFATSAYVMVGANGKYSSADAVFTIAANATYDMTVTAGTLTLNEVEWYTLEGQTITIAEGAAIVIPEGKTLVINGSTIVVNGTATVDGEVQLVTKTSTVKAAAGLNVTTTVAGCKVAYADGKYIVVKLPPVIADDTDDTVISDENKAALGDAMAEAGITEATESTFKVNGEEASAEKVADVLAVFEGITITGDSEEKTVSMDFEFGVDVPEIAIDPDSKKTVVTVAPFVEGATLKSDAPVTYTVDGVEVSADKVEDGKLKMTVDELVEEIEITETEMTNNGPVITTKKVYRSKPIKVKVGK